MPGNKKAAICSCCGKTSSSSSLSSGPSSQSSGSLSFSSGVSTESNCPCCFDGAPLRFRWVCPLVWNPGIIKCVPHFEDIYNDNVLHYRGPTLGLPAGRSECVWTTNEGYISSKLSGPAECALCVDSGAFGSFGFLPAIRLTMSKASELADCVWDAQLQFSLTVGTGCIATGPLNAYAWRNNATTQPFIGCNLEYTLERLNIATPNVNATITPE